MIDTINELNIREFIERGVKKPLLFYSPFYEEAIKFRPLGELEIHECFNKPLNTFSDDETLKAYMDLKNQGKISLAKYDILKIDIKALSDAMNEVVQWIVYTATKDFQDEDYTYEDVKYLKGMSDLAHLILKTSGNSSDSKDLINKFIKTPQGESLAYLINFRGYKLAELQELTPLQKSFLIRADPERMKIEKEWELQGMGVGVLDFNVSPEEHAKQLQKVFGDDAIRQNKQETN